MSEEKGDVTVPEEGFATLAKFLLEVDERLKRLEDSQEGALKESIRLSDNINTLHKRQEKYRREQKTEEVEELKLAVGKVSARLADLEEKVRLVIDQLPALGEPGGLREDQ